MGRSQIRNLEGWLDFEWYVGWGVASSRPLFHSTHQPAGCAPVHKLSRDADVAMDCWKICHPKRLGSQKETEILRCQPLGLIPQVVQQRGDEERGVEGDQGPLRYRRLRHAKGSGGIQKKKQRHFEHPEASNLVSGECKVRR